MLNDGNEQDISLVLPRTHDMRAYAAKRALS